MLVIPASAIVQLIEMVVDGNSSDYFTAPVNAEIIEALVREGYITPNNRKHTPASVPRGYAAEASRGEAPPPSAFKQLRERHISSLELSVRLTNVLTNVGEIHTLGDLIDANRDQIARLQYVGPVLLKELTDTMAQHKLEFGMDETDYLLKVERN
jgi:DNA-directed RNA polymerase alpha subunit